MAGRKPIVVQNPFVVDGENILWCTEDDIDIRIEDCLVGIIRTFSDGQAFVSWQKLLRVYRNVDVLTRQNIQNYLMCSESQAKRYIQVIKSCNLFIQRYVDGKSGGTARGYVHIQRKQIQWNIQHLEKQQ